MTNNILSILNQLMKSGKQNISPFSLDIDFEKFKKIIEHTFEPDKTTNQGSNVANEELLNELLQTNGFIKIIYENYLFNLIPKSIANELYIINIDVFEDRHNIQDIFDKITENFDTLLYKIAHHIIVSGGFGLWIVDKTKIRDILDNKLIKKEDINYYINFMNYDYINNETVNNNVKLESRNHSNNNNIDYKKNKNALDNIETVLVHKSRVRPIKLLNLFTIGYIVAGNLLEDLSKPYTAGSGKSETSSKIHEFVNILQKLNIKLTQKEINEIKEFIGESEFTFIPVTDFTFVELPSPYNKGLLINLEWHAKLLNIVRALLANHAIKFQDLLIVKVDASEIAKPKVGEYLQAALTGLRSRLYTAENSTVPITALPSLLAPLQIMFIPTYAGKDAITFETLTLNFNPDLANLLEQVRNDIALDSGIPHPLLVNDQIDMAILTQLNGLFYQKIVFLQTQIEKGIKEHIDKILYKLNPDMYFALHDLYTFGLNKPVQTIVAQLSDIITNITNFAMNVDNPKVSTIIQRLLKTLLGEDVVKLFDTADLEVKEIIKKKIEDIYKDINPGQQQQETGEQGWI